MIVTLPVQEAEARLSALIAEVAKGGEVVLTDQGVPMARLVAPVAGFDREKARAAAAALLDASRGLSLGGLTIRDMIDEGRR